MPEPGTLTFEMTITFYLPAHPVYFNYGYSQEEIDKAIEDFRKLVSPSRSDVEYVYQFLRQQGKDIQFVLRSDALRDREHAVSQLRQTAPQQLEAFTSVIKALLKANRAKFLSGKE